MLLTSQPNGTRWTARKSRSWLVNPAEGLAGAKTALLVLMSPSDMYEMEPGSAGL